MSDFNHHLTHAARSASFLEDESRTNWHNGAVMNFRKKRDATIKAIPEWEELRSLASAIKENVLGNLDNYLEQFEKAATENGVKVHWAADAAAHNLIVHEILKNHQVTRIVKSKSILTEECGLNPYLESLGIEVIDTDLGERIIQMRDEPPSHIIAPAIHLKREEVSDLFHDRLQTEKGNTDPTYLTRAARIHLREKFLQAQAGITGVNFAVAETGGVVIITNEGNADMGCNLPPLQIHCVGIEKIIPKWEHLGVFLRLLAPSASGQKSSIYASHYHRAKNGGEMHIVLVDNGRSDHLGSPDFRNTLKCIRCSACINTCPVYRRTGGYSYHSVVAGPIGSILNPARHPEQYNDLPFASSLCGSCSDVCPVKIDIHNQLYHLRQTLTEKGHVSFVKKTIMKMAAGSMSHAGKFSRSMKWMRRHLGAPRWLLYSPFNVWGKTRELPTPPAETFSEWYLRNRRKN